MLVIILKMGNNKCPGIFKWLAQNQLIVKEDKWLKIDSNFTRLPQISKVLTFQNVVENWRISVLETILGKCNRPQYKQHELLSQTELKLIHWVNI